MEEQSKEEKFNKLVDFFTDGNYSFDASEVSFLYLMAPELRDKVLKVLFNKEVKEQGIPENEMKEMISKEKETFKEKLGFDVSPFIDFSPVFES